MVMLLHTVYTLLLAYLVCSQVVAVDSVTLSTDALPIPGGYIVPERGNVTFTCNSSVGGALFWTVNLQIPDGTATFTTSAGLSNALPNVSSPDTSPTANPASFTVHYITLENNRSLVECFDRNSGNSSAAIIVEGFPTCPTLQTTVASEMLTVSLQKSSIMWLPKYCYVDVTSDNGTVFNSTLLNDEPFEVTSLQPGTVYNISITPCNIVGCNESCDIHSVKTLLSNERRGGVSAQPLPLHQIFIGIVAGLATTALLLTIIVFISIPCLLCVARRRKRKKKGRAESGKTPPRQPETIYAELTMYNKHSEGNGSANALDDRSTKMPEYAEAVRSTKSVKGNSLQEPTRHAAFTHASGASALEYSTVQDAIQSTGDASIRKPLSHTPSLPPFSPPFTPLCLSPDVSLFPGKVQDVGYACLPHSQGPQRITKVRNTRRNSDQTPDHAVRADSPTSSFV